MPVYEYRCRTCTDTYEVSRPMSQANDPAPCPGGHQDTTRILSIAMVGGRESGSSKASTGSAGGCCGGGCCG